jgi:thioredoxin-related protein
LKRLILLALFAMLVVPRTFASPWIKSLATAQKKAKDSHQLIFVDLYADWCGWCHRMEQEVFPSEAFQKATDSLVLLRLNTEDGSDGTNLARRFQVTSLPTFLLLTSDATLAGAIRGYLPPNDFVSNLRDVQGKYSEFMVKVQNEPKITGDYPKRLDLALEFITRQDYAAGEVRLKKLIAEPNVPPDVRDKAYYDLAAVLANEGKKDESIKTIQKFGTIATKGESIERARLLVSQIYYEQGNLIAAASELRRFKTAFPNSILMRNVDYLLPQIEAQLRK